VIAKCEQREKKKKGTRELSIREGAARFRKAQIVQGKRGEKSYCHRFRTTRSKEEKFARMIVRKVSPAPRGGPSITGGVEEKKTEVEIRGGGDGEDNPRGRGRG